MFELVRSGSPFPVLHNQVLYWFVNAFRQFGEVISSNVFLCLCLSIFILGACIGLVKRLF